MRIDFRTIVFLFLLVGTSGVSWAQLKKDSPLFKADEKMAEFYTREEIPLPRGEVMEMSSIALMPDEKVAVTNRRGEVWICEGAYEDDLSGVKWTKAYDGLHEPLGMYWKEGALYFTDRDQFGKLIDRDGDGRTDVVETICDDWGINGDYHEYAFGSEPDAEGNVWTVLCLTGSAKAGSDFRGWCVRVTPDGEMIPTCSGIRSPGGIGFDTEGHAYYTDNQGLWNGTSCLKHLVPGKFMGNYTGNVYYKLVPGMGAEPKPVPAKGMTIDKARAMVPELVPPAIQLPHAKVGQSPTAIVPDHTGGRFGPFGTQVLVGEQTHSEVQRVFLETVNGVRQGCVWKLLNGFRAGIVPMRLSDEGVLFVGGTNRGWSSYGGKAFTFERVKWTGKVPFEMKTMEARPKGFKLSFTKPVDRALAQEVKSYEMKAWTYKYQSGYGSPEIEQVTPQVVKAEVSKDGVSVELEISGLVKGHVHHLKSAGLKSAEGEMIWHGDAYYTLNEIPFE